MQTNLTKYDMIMSVRDTMIALDEKDQEIEGCFCTWEWMEQKLKKCMDLIPELENEPWEKLGLYDYMLPHTKQAKLQLMDVYLHTIYDECLCYKKGYRTPEYIDEARMNAFVSRYLRLDDFISKKKNCKKLSTEHRGQVFPERKWSDMNEII